MLCYVGDCGDTDCRIILFKLIGESARVSFAGLADRSRIACAGLTAEPPALLMNV